MVVGRDQEARRAGRRVVDRLADLRVDHPHDGADDVARRAELAQLARLLDLPEHMLEQVALGVGVGLVEPQPVDQPHHLGQHGGLVDHQPGAGHEVGAEAVGHGGEEREHLVAHPAHQRLAGHAARPDRPAHPRRRDGLDALGRRVERVPQLPVAGEDRRVLAPHALGLGDVVGVDALDQVEEEQERQLLGVAQRIGIAAAIEVVADLVDAAPHLGGERHGRLRTPAAG